MDESHGAILGEPSRSLGVQEMGHALARIRPGNAIAERVGQSLANHLDVGECHGLIVPAKLAICRTEPMSSVH
jgi:hypothetical protein